MSDNSTTLMLDYFRLIAGVPGYFASMFKMGPRSVHTTEKVELDVVREEEDIAVAVPTVNSGYRANEHDKFVNKGFTPPIFKESFGITLFESMKRQPGANPFENPDFARAAGNQAFDGIRRLTNKVRRSVELMASQVMQTGVINLVDSTGVAIFNLDLGMRSSHKITATTWAADGSTGTPLADISSTAQIIRKDGKRRANKITFGNGAFQRFLANPKVQLQLDKFKFNLGALTPGMRNDDATFYGYIWIDNYQYELWLLDSYYKHPQTGTLTPYMADNKVLISCSDARMDLTWGLIPRIIPPDARVQQFMPGRLSAFDLGMDLQTFSYIPADGESVVVNLGARPFCLPTELDSYACLTVF